LTSRRYDPDPSLIRCRELPSTTLFDGASTIFINMVRLASIDQEDSGADNTHLIVPVEVKLMDRATAIISIVWVSLIQVYVF